MKVGDLIKFKDTGMLATIVESERFHGQGESYALFVHGNAEWNLSNPTWVSRTTAVLRAEVINEAR